MNHYYFSIKTILKSLRASKNLIEKVQKQIQIGETKLSEKEILEGKLAPDMFNFTKQIQLETDNAKGITARLVGTEAPVFEDNEDSLQSLAARLDKTIEYVSSFEEKDFEKSEEHKIILRFIPGKYQDAMDYVLGYGLPNFYFHHVTSYSILRHLGMKIGKMDYIDSLNLKDLQE